MAADGAEHPAGLRLAGSGPADAVKSGQVEAGEQKPALPPTTTYQRGQFTFNRRFIETKFPGFFGVVRRDADRDMVLIIKSSRGEYFGQRISRIAANDLHLQVQRGHATEEVMIPFVETMRRLFDVYETRNGSQERAHNLLIEDPPQLRAAIRRHRRRGKGESVRRSRR